MKHLLHIFLLLNFAAYSQSDAYVDLSMDPNKLFQVIDNPRTKTNHTGLDFDFEIGARSRELGLYIFYGRFENATYQNYGAGLDWYLAKGTRYDIAIGAAVSNVMRKQYFGINNNKHWGTYLGWSTRLKGVLWVFPQFGISGRFQYQRRPDINVHGILEGSIGLTFKFAQKD